MGNTGERTIVVSKVDTNVVEPLEIQVDKQMEAHNKEIENIDAKNLEKKHKSSRC